MNEYTLDQLLAEAKADQEAGNLIPGGFDGRGEFSDELEAAIHALNDLVTDGMTEREQRSVAAHIYKALASIQVDRHKDSQEEESA